MIQLIQEGLNNKYNIQKVLDENNYKDLCENQKMLLKDGRDHLNKTSRTNKDALFHFVERYQLGEHVAIEIRNQIAKDRNIQAQGLANTGVTAMSEGGAREFE